MKNAFDGIAERAAQANPRRPDDYERDGLLYCAKCHTPKQCRVVLLGQNRVMPCACKCIEQETQKAKSENEKVSWKNYVLAFGQLAPIYSTYTLEADDGKNESLTKFIRRYIDNFNTALNENVGLSLWGDVGTGKTFYAAVIANALIEKGYRVKMTSVSRIVNSLGEVFGEERNRYIDAMNRCDLLILDDFGVERTSEYVLEIVYAVVDGRYKAGKPMIVTTNLTKDEMASEESELRLRRVYDRIGEMCVPVLVKGTSRRKNIKDDKVARFSKMLSGGDAGA